MPNPKTMCPNPSTVDALDMLEDVSARARAQGIALCAYPVEDVEAVCVALRAVRGKGRAFLQPTI